MKFGGTLSPGFFGREKRVSQPISNCAISAAIFGPEEEYEKLLKALRYNVECGHWSYFPCECDPPCRAPTREQVAALNERLARDTTNPMNITVPPGYRKIAVSDFEEWLRTDAPDYVRDGWANGARYAVRRTKEEMAVVLAVAGREEVWMNPAFLPKKDEG